MIDLRCCDVGAILGEVHGVALVHADPPWSYDHAAVQGAAANAYALLGNDAIAGHIDAAYDAAGTDA